MDSDGPSALRYVAPRWIAASEHEPVARADVNGSLKLLARTQPSLEAARYGVTIEARPGGVRAGKPRPFGYDVQVRQSGRLLARVRMAGRCVEHRESRGLVVRCRIARRSAELH